MRVDALLDFGVGQRAIRRLERQPDREADGALGDALALVPIEERDRRRAARPDCRSRRAA